MNTKADQALKTLVCAIDHMPTPRRVKLCSMVLEDKRFYDSPGGSEHHHNYQHGLVIHVSEVMNNVFKMRAYPSEALITAVVWHDYMKIRDYSLITVGDASQLVVIKNPYRKLINHVAGSYGEYYLQARLNSEEESFIDEVSHLLLSHHGRREWGSPVEPMTAEAMILLTADLMSAKGIIL